MAYEFLEVERDGFIATVTMKRPDRLNALNTALTRDLHLVLDELAGEFPDIRTIILTGQGRGFCSGADVGAMANALQSDGATPSAYDPLTNISTLAPKIRHTAQPVIAAVNGAAVGGGLSLALACDVRIASEAARFSCIFVKRSLVPDTGASMSLPRLVGPGIAAEMALTGGVYDASWALAQGLVNRVVPADKLLSEARALGEEIASNPPLALRSIKQLLYREERLEDALPYERDANTPASHSEDRREAVMSFLEKRTPIYHGR